MVKRVYVAHAVNHPNFKETLYNPLKTIEGVEFVFPHENEGEMKSSKEMIKKCDFFVADVSFQKFGTGMEIGYASAFDVPIIFIYKRGSNLSRSLNLVSDNFIEYDNIEDVLEKLKILFN